MVTYHDSYGATYGHIRRSAIYRNLSNHLAINVIDTDSNGARQLRSRLRLKYGLFLRGRGVLGEVEGGDLPQTILKRQRVDLFGNARQTHEVVAATFGATATAARTGACSGCFEDIEEVAFAFVNGGEQRFEVVIQSGELRAVERLVGIQLGGHGDLLTTLHQSGVEAIAEVELGAAVVRGNQYLAFQQRVTDA